MKYLRIEEFAKVITGGTPSTKVEAYWNGDIPWLNSGELNRGVIDSSSNFITKLGLDNSSARIMPRETVLIALTGATTGVTALLKIEACANQSVTGILPSPNHVPKYLYYYLTSIREKVIGQSYGGAQKHISQGFVKKIVVPLPSIEDQKRIVKILDEADTLRQKRKQAIGLLDDYLKSVFLEMFGNLYSNNKNWTFINFGNYILTLTDYHANGSYEILKKNVTLLDELNYALMVRTTDLENNNFEKSVKYIDKHAYEFLEKSKVFGGEIIINKIGSAGKVYLMPKLNRPVSLGMNAFLLRFKENADAIFMYYLLTSQYGEAIIQKKVKGAVTKTIRKDAIRDLKVPNITLNLQNKFSEIFIKTDLLKQKMLAQSEELETQFQALTQKAFKGEL